MRMLLSILLIMRNDGLIIWILRSTCFLIYLGILKEVEAGSVCLLNSIHKYTV